MAEESRNLVQLKQERKQLREANLSAFSSRVPLTQLKHLDSSIKRNTSFIKKLKTISEEQKENLCQELSTLNLSRYISEVVAAIVEAKLKPSDISASVKICSLLHQRYPDFANQLIPSLTKAFTTIQTTNPESEQDKNAKVARRRILLRLFGELLIVGVTKEADALVHLLQELISSDINSKKTNDGNNYQNLSLIVSFLRAIGEDLFGIKSKKVQNRNEQENETQTQDTSYSTTQSEIEEQILPLELQQNFVRSVDNYFDSVTAYLSSEHKELRAKERENHHLLETKGELSEGLVQSYDKFRKSYEKLLANVTSFADLLNKDMPYLPEDQHTTRVDAISGTISVGSSFGASRDKDMTDSVFDDEDTKSFYENLPDVRALVPAVLFGESEASTPTPNKEKDSDIKTKDTEKETEENETAVGANALSSLDALLQRLPSCVNRDLIDQAAIEFCYSNSKANRKKLVKALFNVPRTQLSLIAHYSRMVATLNQCMKDIGPMLVSMLEEEFQALYQKKDQINIETKIRNIRFLGELAKFKICPATVVLSCFKLCLDDFVHHNIEVACNLCETCGRFLYRTPETHVRMKNLLEIMMRLKNAQNLQNRLDTMVENAYYQCIPPERQAVKQKIVPPLHLYIQRLIYVELNKNTTKYVLKQLRKLPWNDLTVETHVLKTLLNVHKGKYNNIHLVASLVAGLATYHESLGVRFVDVLLELIQRGLEISDFTTQQRQIMLVKLLGELYNYCMIESQVVFDALNLFITLNHSIVDGRYELSPAPGNDTPTDYFRIRLVCTLLDTCGQYFDRGSSKKKLDRYLLYFQRYFLSKASIPVDVEFSISDCLESLRPNLKRIQNYNDACEQIVKLEHEEAISQPPTQKAPTLNGNVQPVEESDSESEERDDESVDDNDDDQDEEEPDQEDDNLDENDESDHDGRNVDNEDEMISIYRPRRLPSAEDDLFDREFNKIMQESLESRKFEPRQASRMDIHMAIPMNLLRSSKTDEEKTDHVPDPGVEFRVLMKKGTKQTVKNVTIPAQSPLAINTSAKLNSEREEQKELKRLVLAAEEREEDEFEEEFPALSINQRTVQPRAKQTKYHNKKPFTGGQHKNHRQSYS